MCVTLRYARNSSPARIIAQRLHLQCLPTFSQRNDQHRLELLEEEPLYLKPGHRLDRYC